MRGVIIFGVINSMRKSVFKAIANKAVVSFVFMILVSSFVLCSCSSSKIFASKYDEDSMESRLVKIGIDPEKCTIEKISAEGETDVYEVTTDCYNLEKELTFKVFRDSSTSAIGITSWYWDDNMKEELFYILYPPEQWPKVLKAHCGYSPDFEVDPMNFYEDIQSVMETADKIVEIYDSHGFSKDMIIGFCVQGRCVDTKRQDGVTIGDYYLEDVSKELIYQGLFENSQLANINDENIDEFNSKHYRSIMENNYLAWAIENGLEDVYSNYSLKERKSVNNFESNRYYYAVIDGEVTDETEEIFAEYNGNLSYSSFFKVLKRQGYPVEGNWYHFKFTGIDGKKYEFGYDQCILEPDPVSSENASDQRYSRTFNNFYYICDGEKYIYSNLKLDDRSYDRTNINWEPIVYTGAIRDITGLNVTSTYEK